MTDAKNTLLPCPFCGEADQETLIIQHMDGTIMRPAYRVWCDNCEASTNYSDRGGHVEKWNTRAAHGRAVTTGLPMPPADFRAARKALGLSQQQLSDVMGVRQATVSAWETGKHTPEGPAVRLIRLYLVLHEQAPHLLPEDWPVKRGVK